MRKNDNNNKMILDKIVCYSDRQMIVEIAEISKQHKQFEVFLATNTNLGIFWINQNKRKQVKMNRQVLHLNIV